MKSMDELRDVYKAIGRCMQSMGEYEDAVQHGGR
jgi:hypothetical protein